MLPAHMLLQCRSTQALLQEAYFFCCPCPWCCLTLRTLSEAYINSAPTGRLLKCHSVLTLHSCDQKAHSFSKLCTSWKTKSMMHLFASSTLLHIHSVPHIHTWAIYDEFSAVGDGSEMHLAKCGGTDGSLLRGQ